MKHILLSLNILVLSACGADTDDRSPLAEAPDVNDVITDKESFTLQNVRFDSKDFYDDEQVSVTEGTNFEVQWVSPTSTSYKIDLYLSTHGEVHSDTNKIVGLKCGNASFSLCPNATGEIQCKINDNTLSCSVGRDSVGSESFQDKDLSSLKFIIKGCDTLSNCDVKAFNLSVTK